MKTIKYLKLNTVTYGTKSAPVLATRMLQQLALDEGYSFPLSSKVLKNDFYIDGALIGAGKVNDALQLKLELQKLLLNVGFELRKFGLNVSTISSLSDLSSTIALVVGLSWNTL